MQVSVDRDRCTAIGMCESHAPDIFVINDDDELDVADEIPAARESSVRRAVSSCPVNALSLT
ncbi:ferredoxin [Mycolicibacterium sp. 22603]|uniref:ferredoxin n=1 Tax=Mycolicibacterium sp. 22603 TaxID=3453950 RepID=UPI003F876E10